MSHCIYVFLGSRLQPNHVEWENRRREAERFISYSSQTTTSFKKNEEEQFSEDIGVTTKLILEEVKKLSARFDVQEKRIDELSDKFEDNCMRVTELTAEVTQYKAKDCEVCKKESINFAEDMIKEDREARMLVWSKMKEARSQNKRAYYRGPFAYIEGVCRSLLKNIRNEYYLWLLTFWETSSY